MVVADVDCQHMAYIKQHSDGHAVNDRFQKE